VLVCCFPGRNLPDPPKRAFCGRLVSAGFELLADAANRYLAQRQVDIAMDGIQNPQYATD
jgi:hypothetical protein